jgi:trans-aconitate methyltransferase
MQVLDDSAPRPNREPPPQWDAHKYDSAHAFVWRSAGGIVEWLAPQAGEEILDVGCGTGHVTAQIAQSGARVTGMDSSPEMLETARREHPQGRWIEGDAREFSLSSLGLAAPLDAIFSNATLHWVRPPESFLACAASVLKPGGRLAAEFGGRGNVEQVLSALETGLRAVSAHADVRENYFPAVGEYATLCEAAGLEVLRAELFDRPTPLSGQHGLREWATMFRPHAVASVPPAQHEELFAAMEEDARARLFRDGTWFADYRRLRIFARKS